MTARLSVYVAIAAPVAVAAAERVLTRARSLGARLYVGDASRSLKSQMREADKRDVDRVVIVGHEVREEPAMVTVRNMRDHYDSTMPLSEIDTALVLPGD